MPSRKWRLLVFVLAFTCVMPHRCVAGPISRFCVATRSSVPSLPSVPQPNPFSNFLPRSVAFPRLPTTLFQLGGVHLMHVTSPPEFRAHFDGSAWWMRRASSQDEPRLFRLRLGCPLWLPI